jgi:hypothetical protein
MRERVTSLLDTIRACLSDAVREHGMDRATIIRQCFMDALDRLAISILATTMLALRKTEGMQPLHARGSR